MSVPVMKGYARLNDCPRSRSATRSPQDPRGREGDGGLLEDEGGAHATMHQHPHEQIFWMISGKMEFDLAGEKRTCVAGDLG